MGNLWGVVRTNRKNVLARWSPAGWCPAAVLGNSPIAKEYNGRWKMEISETEPSAAFGMERLIPGPDGSVLAIDSRWRAPSVQVRGDLYRWVPPLEQEKSWAVYEDSDGKGWILGTSPENLLTSDTGRPPRLLSHPPKLLYSLPDDLDYRQLVYQLRNANLVANPLLKDGLGRYWYTSTPSMELNARNESGHSLLVFDKDYLKRPSRIRGNQVPISVFDGTEIHEVSGGDPRAWRQEYVCFVTPKDEHTLWVGTSCSGLYQMDLTNLTAKSVSVDSQPWCEGVTQVARLGDNWYAVAEQKGFQLYQITSTGPSLVVGQLDGELTPFAYDSGIGRPILETKKGLWLGCDKNGGAYFVPKDGTDAVRIGWNRGLLHREPTFIESLPDGKLFFGGPGGNDFVAEEDALITAKESASRMESVRPHFGLFQDINGNIWALDAERPKPVLKRWESGIWRNFDIPYVSNGEDGPFGRLVCDSSGRLWLPFYYATGAVSIFLPPPPGSQETGVWIQYPNYPEAVLKEYPVGMRFDLAEGDRELPMLEINEGIKGSLAFTDNNAVYYYDGSAWLHWRTKDIIGKEDCWGPRRASFDVATGDLFYYSGRDFYRYTPTKRWEIVPNQDRPTIPLPVNILPWTRRIAAPDYAPANPRSVCRDYLGLLWLQYGTAIYRAGYGLCLCVIDKDEKTPLLLGGRIYEAMPCLTGDTWFFQVAGEYLLLHPDRPVPDTEVIVASQFEPDVPVVDVSAGEGVKAWFTWRSGQGEWQQAGTSPLIIKGLDPGDHRIEVRAIDERFQLDPTPVSLSVTIPEYQEILQGLVDEMSSEDNGVREKALARFMQRGKEDVLNLKVACEKAWSDMEKWLDLQRVLRTRHYPRPRFGMPFWDNQAF